MRWLQRFLVGIGLILCVGNAWSADFWTHLNGPKGVTIQDYAISSDGAIMLRNYQFARAIGNNLYASLDQGASWNELTNVPFTPYDLDALYTFDTNNFYALVNYSFDDYGEVYFSEDNGSTWSRLFSVYDIFTQNNINTAFREITCFYYNPANNIYYVGTYDKGVFVSSDLLTWTHLDLSGLADTNGNIKEVTAIGIDNNGHIYAASGEYIFRSDNGGISWTKSNIPSERYFGGYVRNIIVKPNSTILAFGSGNNLWKSLDSGVNWQYIGIGDDGACVLNQAGALIGLRRGTPSQLSISYDDGNSWQVLSTFEYLGQDLSLNNGKLYCGGTFGLYCTENYGVSWSCVTNDFALLSGPIISDMSHYLYTTSNGLLFRSNDNGNNWVRLGSDIFGLNTAVWHLGCSQTGIVLTDHYISYNYGNNWSAWATENGVYNNISPIGVDKHTGEIYATAFDADFVSMIIKSADDMATWDAINTGDISDLYNIRNVIRDSKGDLFIDSQYKIIKISTDNEPSVIWESPMVDKIQAMPLGIDKNDVLFLSIVDNTNANYPYRVIWSDNEGDSWNENSATDQIYSGFSFGPGGVMVASHRINSDTLELVMSYDRGKSWTNIDYNLVSQMPIPNNPSCQYDSDGYLYFTGYYNGN